MIFLFWKSFISKVKNFIYKILFKKNKIIINIIINKNDIIFNF